MMAFDQEQASAAVPVTAVVTGDGLARVVARTRLIAYRAAARSNGRMQLTRAFRATVKGFNADYGLSCRSWADVLVKVTEMMGEGK